MVQFGDNDLVTGSPVSSQRAREMKSQRRHVRAEGDLVRRGVQKLGAHPAGVFNCRVSLFAGRIGPMSVGVVMIEIVGHRFADLTRHLSSAGAVEVRDWLTQMDTFQCGKMRAYRGG